MDELYQVPLDTFVAARDALAARLKAAGDKKGALAVRGVRKPSVPAWAANQVFWGARADWDRLLASAAALRRAHEAGASPDDLRRARREEREALAACEARAGAALAAHGHAATPAVLQKVGGTLLALAHGARGATPGRLEQELAPPGFEALSGLTLPVPEPRPPATPPAGDASPPSDTAPPVDQASAPASEVAPAEEPALARVVAARPIVRAATPADRDAWARLRQALWPDASPDEHVREIDAFFAGTSREPAAVFVAEEPTSGLVAFAEASIRSYAEGCRTDRVGYLEGWYVAPASRRSGLGRALVRAAEDWARGQGCVEFASDTEEANSASAEAHLALGFTDLGLVRCFRKDLS